MLHTHVAGHEISKGTKRLLNNVTLSTALITEGSALDASSSTTSTWPSLTPTCRAFISLYSLGWWTEGVVSVQDDGRKREKLERGDVVLQHSYTLVFKVIDAPSSRSFLTILVWPRFEARSKADQLSYSVQDILNW